MLFIIGSISDNKTARSFGGLRMTVSFQSVILSAAKDLVLNFLHRAMTKYKVPRRPRDDSQGGTFPNIR